MDKKSREIFEGVIQDDGSPVFSGSTPKKRSEFILAAWLRSAWNYLFQRNKSPNESSKAEPEPEIKPKSEAELKTEPETKTEGEPRIELEIKTEPEPNLEPEQKTEPEVKPEPEVESEPKIEPEQEPKKESEEEPEKEIQSESESTPPQNRTRYQSPPQRPQLDETQQ